MSEVFRKGFPWQRLTCGRELGIICKLEPEFDVGRMRAEAERLISSHGHNPQHGRYHDGGWNGLCLHAANGDYRQTRLVKGPYQKTELLAEAPYLNSVLDFFKCEKKRVRLMQLRPGANIHWHCDRTDSLDSKTTRLHIPVRTHADIHFQISHVDCSWQPGELWYGDFSFPHRVRNAGTETRIHLLLDLVIDDWVKGLFPQSMFDTSVERLRVKRECQRWFYCYDTPGRIKHFPQRIRRKLSRVGARLSAPSA